MNKARPRACIGIVAYRNESDLKALLQSVMPYALREHLPVLVLNNDPENPAFLNEVKELFPSMLCFQASENMGYAGGNQFLWQQSQELYDSPFFVVITQDILVQPEGFEAVLQAMEKDETIGQASGYILRGTSLKEARVDSMAIMTTEGAHFFDAGQGELLAEQDLSSIQKKMFGLTGAMFVIRSSLVAHFLRGQLFQSRFWMYKEDIDLAWRLREEGQRACLVPVWMASHKRSLAKENKNFWAFLKHELRKNRTMAFVSYRNHLWLLRDRSWKALDGVSYFAVFRQESLKALYFALWRPLAFVRAWYAFLFCRAALLEPRKSLLQDKSIRLSAVILHHGDPDAVALSIERLKQSNGFDVHAKLELIVVNNGLPSKQALPPNQSSHLPDWMQIRFFQIPNRGYAQGTNFAFAQAQGAFFAILTDVLVEPNTLHLLLERMEEAKKRGEELFAAPRLEYADGSVQDNFRRFPNFLDLLIKRTFLRSIFKNRMRQYLMWDVNPYGQHEVDWLTGAMQVFSRTLWQKIGQKDEDYFLFMSDIDLCEKARACGAKIVFMGDLCSQHGENRLSQGALRVFFTSKMLRIHVRDAVLYFLKKLR